MYFWYSFRYRQDEELWFSPLERQGEGAPYHVLSTFLIGVSRASSSLSKSKPVLWVIYNEFEIILFTLKSLIEVLRIMKNFAVWMQLSMDNNRPVWIFHTIICRIFRFFFSLITQVLARRLENWAEQLSEIILNNLLMHDSMRLLFFFLTAKSEVFSLGYMKSYSRNAHKHSWYQHICDGNRCYLILIVMITT